MSSRGGYARTELAHVCIGPWREGTHQQKDNEIAVVGIGTELDGGAVVQRGSAGEEGPAWADGRQASSARLTSMCRTPAGSDLRPR